MLFLHLVVFELAVFVSATDATTEADVAADAEVDTSGLTRQRPGAMGLGTSQSRPERPVGWVPPKKPDPMTKGRGRRRG